MIVLAGRVALFGSLGIVYGLFKIRAGMHADDLDDSWT
jgi:hypothetical protein